MLSIRSILVPIDFSFCTESALAVAHSLARDHQAQLVLFTVAIPSQATMEVELASYPGMQDVPSLNPWPRAEQAYQQKLAPLAANIVDVPVSTEARVGPPGAAIVNAAIDHKADLIVMGTHGRSGLSRAIMGSTAEYVLRHAPCPVLTLKPGTESHLPPENSNDPVPSTASGQ